MSTKASSSFELKSASLNALALMLRDLDWAALEQSLQARYGDKPGFFENEPVVLDVSAITLDAAMPSGSDLAEEQVVESDSAVNAPMADLDLKALSIMLRRFGLNPVAVRGRGPGWVSAASAAGLAWLDLPLTPLRAALAQGGGDSAHTASAAMTFEAITAEAPDAEATARAAEAAVAEAIAGLDEFEPAPPEPDGEMLGDIPYTEYEQDEAAAMKSLAQEVAGAAAAAQAAAGPATATASDAPGTFSPPPAESHYAHLADVALSEGLAAPASPTLAEATETRVASESVEEAHVGALIIDRSLRTGQQVYARGRDLVVLGAVNFGADVLADGSIHIYGPLRGRAFAGAKGDINARIFSTDMEPQVVSVAGVWKLLETGLGQELAGRPVQARLEGSEIRFEPLKL